MARVTGNRIRESTTTTGTGDLTLGGAESGYRPFSDVCANGDLVGYAIFSSASSLFEVGEGTWNTGGTLTRTLVVTSSNAGALVDLPSGAKSVILTKLVENERSLVPPLRAFPSVSGLILRLSAEKSVLTLNTDDRVAGITDLSGSWANFAASTSARPRFRKNAIAGIRPGIIFDGLANKITSASTKTVNQPFTVVAAFSRWRAASGNQDMYRDSNNGPVFFRNAGNAWAINAGGSVSSTALYDQNVQGELNITGEAAPAVSIQVYNNASAVLSNNGVEVTGTVGTTGFTGTLGIGGNATGTFAPFILYEFLVFNSALGPSDRALLNAYFANALDIRL